MIKFLIISQKVLLATAFVHSVVRVLQKQIIPRAESAERVARERAEELLHSIDDAIRAGSSQLTESDTMLEQACAQLSDNIAALQQAVAAARSSLDAVRSQMQTLNADPEA